MSLLFYLNDKKDEQSLVPATPRLTPTTPIPHLNYSEQSVPYSAVKYGAYFSGLFPVQIRGLFGAVFGGCKTVAKTSAKTLAEIAPYILRIYPSENPSEIASEKT
jgi:hypothetical protein